MKTRALKEEEDERKKKEAKDSRGIDRLKSTTKWDYIRLSNLLPNKVNNECNQLSQRDGMGNG